MFNFSFVDLAIFFQIIFEVLPVSSSGQIKVIELLAVKKRLIPGFLLLQQDDFIQLFNIVSDFAIIKTFYHQYLHYLKQDFWKVSIQVLLANSITLFFLILKDYVLGSYFKEIPQVSLLFTLPMSALFLLSTKFCQGNNKEISYFDSAWIGFFQSFAFFKGISRLTITFASAKWRGIDSDRAFLFSFLLHIPMSLIFIFKYFWTLNFEAKSLIPLLGLEKVIVMVAGFFVAVFFAKIVKQLIRAQHFFYFTIIYFISWLALVGYFFEML